MRSAKRTNGREFFKVIRDDELHSRGTIRPRSRRGNSEVNGCHKFVTSSALVPSERLAPLLARSRREEPDLTSAGKASRVKLKDQDVSLFIKQEFACDERGSLNGYDIDDMRMIVIILMMSIMM